MLDFLEINGIELSYSDEELIDLGLGLAVGKINDKALLNWIITHS
jgi:death-on-curing protein